MEIYGKVHLMFEQSGTFKNEFRKLGYDAFYYDIHNNFGQTDFKIDLFKEIDNGYNGDASLFDNIQNEDLIMAFLPCIYFEAMQANYYQMSCNNLYVKNKKEQYEIVIQRIKKGKNFT